jgi:hypothetical protein
MEGVDKMNDKVVSFSDQALFRFKEGLITYEQFCNIEMLELGYIPSNKKSVKEYEELIESLVQEYE